MGGASTSSHKAPPDAQQMPVANRRIAQPAVRVEAWIWQGLPPLATISTSPEYADG